MQLEDDIVAKPNYPSTMKNFALQQPSEEWMILEFSQLGFIGKTPSYMTTPHPPHTHSQKLFCLDIMLKHMCFIGRTVPLTQLARARKHHQSFQSCTFGAKMGCKLESVTFLYSQSTIQNTQKIQHWQAIYNFLLLFMCH